MRKGAFKFAILLNVIYMILITLMFIFRTKVMQLVYPNPTQSNAIYLEVVIPPVIIMIIMLVLYIVIIRERRQEQLAEMIAILLIGAQLVFPYLNKIGALFDKIIHSTVGIEYAIARSEFMYVESYAGIVFDVAMLLYILTAALSMGIKRGSSFRRY